MKRIGMQNSRQRDGELRLTRVGDVKANTLYKVIHQNVSDDVEFIITDDFKTLTKVA
jgi:hypothetical protein